MSTSSSTYSFTVKIGKDSYPVTVPQEGATVRSLKDAIAVASSLPRDLQKLVGLTHKRAQAIDDSTPLSELTLKSPQKVQVLVLDPAAISAVAEGETELVRRREAEEVAAAVAAAAAEEARRAAEEAARLRAEKRAREEAEAAAEREQEEEARRLSQAQARASQEAPDPTAKVSLTLQCMSAAVANMIELEGTNKIALPPSVLEVLISRRIVSPYTFEVVHGSGESVLKVYASVLSFDAPPDTVVLPQFIMQGLLCTDGSRLSVRTAVLPPASFIRLQPCAAAWLEVPYDDRKPLLEMTLSTFQVLSVGDMIPVTYNFTEHLLTITAVEPPEKGAVRVVDTDVAVDIIEPMEVPSPLTAVAKDQPPQTGTMDTNEYVYYVLHVSAASLPLRIVARALSGDPDLYVSNLVTNMRPTRARHQWSSVSTGESSLTLTGREEDFVEGYYYIGVHAYGGPCEYSLSVENALVDEGHVLGASTTAVPGSTQALSTAAAEGGNTTVCPHCGAAVSNTVFVMHEVRCERSNWRCDSCRAVMALTDKAKHLDIFHTPIACVCGTFLEQPLLKVHQAETCEFRMVECRFCHLHLPKTHMGSHQAKCASTTERCSYCGVYVRRFLLESHVSDVHPETLVPDEAVDMVTTQQPPSTQDML